MSKIKKLLSSTLFIFLICINNNALADIVVPGGTAPTDIPKSHHTMNYYLVLGLIVLTVVTLGIITLIAMAKDNGENEEDNKENNN